MGNSIKWSTLENPTPVSIGKTFFGPIGIINGTDYDGDEGPALAQDFADKVKGDDVVAFFAPSLAAADRVNGEGKKDPSGFNYLGATLKRVVEEGTLVPVIMGRWIRSKKGNAFPQPYLAFFEPIKAGKAAKKAAPTKKGRFARK